MIPFSIMLTMGLGLWGGKQTWQLYELSQKKCLHQHPLFCHVPHATRMVRDIDGGRPDRFVNQTVDVYERPEPVEAPPARAEAQPALLPEAQPFLLPAQRIVRT